MSAAADVLPTIDTVRRFAQERLTDLTDDEAFWEPVPGCWTLRRGEGGKVLNDWSPSPDPPPFTTIAWRVAHVGQSLSSHSRRLFGIGSFTFDTVVLPGDAQELLAFVDGAFELWRTGAERSVGTMTEDLATEVIGLTNHAREHTVEVTVLRHLYRASQPLDDDPFVDMVMRGLVPDGAPRDVDGLVARRPDTVAKAAQQGRWDVIPRLLDLGFPADSVSGGAAALHYAVGANALPTVRLLVEHGADLARRDDEWYATPLGWAEFFAPMLEREDVAEYLRNAEGRAGSPSD
jgi:hypothetical protein